MDFEFRQHLIAQGANTNQLGNLGLMRSCGVNKIVWYGNIGSVIQTFIYLLYLSKGELQVAKAVGFIYWNILLCIISSICRTSFAVKSFLSSVNWAIKIVNT